MSKNVNDNVFTLTGAFGRILQVTKVQCEMSRIYHCKIQWSTDDSKKVTFDLYFLELCAFKQAPGAYFTQNITAWFSWKSYPRSMPKSHMSKGK